MVALVVKSGVCGQRGKLHLRRGLRQKLMGCFGCECGLPKTGEMSEGES